MGIFDILSHGIHILHALDTMPNRMEKPSLKLVIRGHVRNSFESDDLRDFVHELASYFDVDVYVHTWNVRQNSVSWRPIEADATPVTEDTIRSYFAGFDVKKIFVESDDDAKLHGNLEGKLARTKTFAIGWKRYVYGQWKIMDYMREHCDEDDVVVNTRFDLFSNLFVFPREEILYFVRNGYDTTKNIFLRDGLYCGVDNIILGTVKTMHSLVNYIHRHLDSFLEQNNTLKHPEFIVPLVNDELFG